MLHARTMLCMSYHALTPSVSTQALDCVSSHVEQATNVAADHQQHRVPAPQVPRRNSLNRGGSIGQAPSGRVSARRSREHREDDHSASPTPSELQVTSI